MPYSFSSYAGADDKMFGTSQGINLFGNGPMFIQFGAGTAIANTTTETSLLTNTTPAQSATPTSAGFGQYFPADNSSLKVPANGFTVGSFFRVRAIGTITNTGTPTLRIRSGFVNDSATFTAINDTTAITMSTITGTMDFEVESEYIIRALTGSNNIGVRTRIWYNTAVGTRASITQPFTLGTIDCTVNQSFDVRLTWGTASASNSATVQYAKLLLVG
jgi:hypothetical protein